MSSFYRLRMPSAVLSSHNSIEFDLAAGLEVITPNPSSESRLWLELPYHFLCVSNYRVNSELKTNNGLHIQELSN